MCNKIITSMKKLKQEIKNKGLKISWISKELNISQPSLSMYLNEKREIPNEIEFKLRKILKNYGI